LPIISSIIGSNQTSNAINDINTGFGNAVNEGNQVTSGNQANILQAGQTANNTLAGVVGAQGTVLSPYTSLGSTAANTLQQAISPGGSLTSQFSFDPTKIASNPDYQFQLSQGLQAVKQAAAATGTTGSSGTLKGLANYAGGLASNEIGQAYNQALSTYQTNFGNTLNSLTAGTNTGLSATNTLSGALQNFGNTSSANTIGTNQIAGNWGQANATNIENLLTGKGTADAAAALQQGQIWGGLANSVGANAAGALAQYVGIG
jgi:hypothetical protein